MKRNRPLRRTTRALALIIAACFFLVRCLSPQEQAPVENNAPVAPPPGHEAPGYTEFAGAAACQSCHQDVYQKHFGTAHARTSLPASASNIKGSFQPGRNSYAFNPQLQVRMEKRDSGLFQVVYYKGEEKIALRFDMTIGSGAKGQSFAYWSGSKLFQLPITFFTLANQWSNSPVPASPTWSCSTGPLRPVAWSVMPAMRRQPEAPRPLTATR
jgi:hypothetical protein